MWRLWCKAIGTKASIDDKEADKIAMIRTVLTGIAFTAAILTIPTSIFIMVTDFVILYDRYTFGVCH